MFIGSVCVAHDDGCSGGGLGVSTFQDVAVLQWREVV